MEYKEALENERVAHQVCVEMLNDAQAEIGRLRSALSWIENVDPEIVEQAREKFALEQNGK